MDEKAKNSQNNNNNGALELTRHMNEKKKSIKDDKKDGQATRIRAKMRNRDSDNEMN